MRRQHLSQHKLLVGVWHNDFWRHNQFLGEVILPLDKVDLSNPSDKWYSLEESVSVIVATVMRTSILRITRMIVYCIFNLLGY